MNKHFHGMQILNGWEIKCSVVTLKLHIDKELGDFIDP